MPYDEHALDLARALGFARKVAADTTRTHSSQLTHRTTRTTRRLFSTRQSSQLHAEKLDGWILVQDRWEGLATFNKINREAWTECREDGRFLMLKHDGELLSGRYTSHFYSSFVGDEATGTSTDIFDLTPVRDAQSIVSFDRTNTGHYRESRTMLPGEKWRRELARNFRVTVPHAGMAVSLALKRLRESGTFVHELSPSF